MRLRAISLVLAASSLLATPVLAAGNPAASLSVAHSARAGATVGKSNALVGGGTYALIGFLVFVGIVVGIEEGTNDNNNSSSR